jgi:hypothetical protein
VALTELELLQLTPAQQTAAASLSVAATAWLASLCDRLIVLKQARFSPTRRVRFKNGEEVQYNSDAEIGSAIAALEAEIAEFLATPAPRHLRVSMRSGFTA